MLWLPQAEAQRPATVQARSPASDLTAALPPQALSGRQRATPHYARECPLCGQPSVYQAPVHSCLHVATVTEAAVNSCAQVAVGHAFSFLECAAKVRTAGHFEELPNCPL